VAYFQSLLEFNRLRADIVPAAVGAESSEATLSFPERESWLGSVSLGGEEEISSHPGVKTVKVPVVTLDEVVDERGLQPGLVKIDTEGFELQVIQGSTATLETHRPMVLFESNTPSDRVGLMRAFELLNFGIYPLDETLFSSPRRMSEEELVSAEPTNFMALHAEHRMVR
jgi:FkbM family methyltransferase